MLGSLVLSFTVDPRREGGVVVSVSTMNADSPTHAATESLTTVRVCGFWKILQNSAENPERVATEYVIKAHEGVRILRHLCNLCQYWGHMD